MRVTYEVHIEKSSNNFGNSSIWLLQNEDCGKNANGIRPFPTIYNDLQDHSTISNLFTAIHRTVAQQLVIRPTVGLLTADDNYRDCL